jgi:hypothetical protein
MSYNTHFSNIKVVVIGQEVFKKEAKLLKCVSFSFSGTQLDFTVLERIFIAEYYVLYKVKKKK